MRTFLGDTLHASEVFKFDSFVRFDRYALQAADTGQQALGVKDWPALAEVLWRKGRWIFEACADGCAGLVFQVWRG
jgi:hypothetical protein